MTRRAHFTEPTTDYWQRFVREDELPDAARPGDGPWQYGYPVRLPDGRFLVLPIRQLRADSSLAVASLISNQASLEVVDALGVMLARLLEPYAPEVVIGMPTLGLAFAPVVARELGLERMVPLSYSRKYWYDEALSAKVQSITAPDDSKRVYLDPNLVTLLRGRRVVLVDDAVSSGATLDAPWRLVESLGVEVLACGVVMRQSDRWVATRGSERAAKVVGVFDTPMLTAVAGGWVIR
ncbi:MAG: phosphoribosyltransferase [Trueperaceae bacterium]|nr:phosphoribosyltransferase [Trueperaceae bacterium]